VTNTVPFEPNPSEGTATVTIQVVVQPGTEQFTNAHVVLSECAVAPQVQTAKDPFTITRQGGPGPVPQPGCLALEPQDVGPGGQPATPPNGWEFGSVALEGQQGGWLDQPPDRSTPRPRSTA
jgi:hypothetical protein